MMPISSVAPMAKSCRKPVKTNPFVTYRDAQTGKWVVVKSIA